MMTLLACFSFCYYFKNNVYKKIVSSKHVQYWITIYFIHDHIYHESIFSAKKPMQFVQLATGY